MYAVYKGRIPGIYMTWIECKNQINGFSGAKFKKFDNIIDAKKFVKTGEISDTYIINNKVIDRNKSIINIYTDGSCYGNGNKISYGGFGIYSSDLNIKYSESLSSPCTNNIAEINAILKTLELIEDFLKDETILINIYTDSEYSIKAFTTFGDKCHKMLWKNNPKNKELIKLGYYKIKSTNNIRFNHIYSHTGKSDIHSIGNENADNLANLGLLKSIDNSDNIGYNKFKNGKYKGQSLNHIKDIDITYLSWYLKNKPYKKEDTFLYILKKYIN